MVFRKALLALTFAFVPPLAIADTGTPEQQAACRPDVRKFCSKLALGSPDRAYQDCLEMNRDKVSAKCQRALAGQRPGVVVTNTTNDGKKMQGTGEPIALSLASYCGFSFDCF